MSDLIDRQQTIEAICMETCGVSLKTERCMVHCTEVQTVEKLPPARPQRIKGHWIESNGLNILMKKFIEKGETWRVCDKCGVGFMIGYQYECDKAYHETFHNFCPKCGADMREVTT